MQPEYNVLHIYTVQEGLQLDKEFTAWGEFKEQEGWLRLVQKQWDLVVIGWKLSGLQFCVQGQLKILIKKFSHFLNAPEVGKDDCSGFALVPVC